MTTSRLPPHGRPSRSTSSTATPYRIFSGFDLASSPLKILSRRLSSTQPPDSEPQYSPSSLHANNEPVGRGEEPKVSMMVHNQQSRPAFSHVLSCARTC